MAVASAGPYASLHLAPDRQPHQHPTTQFFYRMPFLPPNQQRQSTEGKTKLMEVTGKKTKSDITQLRRIVRSVNLLLARLLHRINYVHLASFK